MLSAPRPLGNVFAAVLLPGVGGSGWPGLSGEKAKGSQKAAAVPTEPAPASHACSHRVHMKSFSLARSRLLQPSMGHVPWICAVLCRQGASLGMGTALAAQPSQGCQAQGHMPEDGNSFRNRRSLGSPDALIPEPAPWPLGQGWGEMPATLPDRGQDHPGWEMR